MKKIDQPSRSIITLSENNQTRGNTYKLYKKRSKTELRKNFFSNRVIDHWNALSNDAVTAPSINSFKNRLNNHWKTTP